MAEFTKGAKLTRIEQNLDRPVEALKQVGMILVASSQRAFREQKFGEKQWDERPAPNILGIIADFHEGKKSPPARRFEGRPALRDTGRLAASITYKAVGADSVEVGSNLPYAGLMHHGGETESKPITEQVRNALAAWFKTKNGKPHRKALGWLLAKKFAGKTIKSRVRARPFLGLTRESTQDVLDVIAVEVMEARP